MKTGRGNLFLPLIVAAAILVGSISSADAEVLTFTLDESQTSLVLTEVFLETLGLFLDHQEPGVSDISTLIGTQDVELDDLVNPTTISFLSGDMAMVNNGEWLPDYLGGTDGDPGTPQSGAYGTEYVDDGLGVYFYSVFRDSTLSLTMWEDAPNPIPVTGGSFPWDDPNGKVMVDVTAGSWDWNLDGIFGQDHNGGEEEPVDGADNLNTALTNGTYAVIDGVPTLTLPFHSRLGEEPDGTPSNLLAVFDGVIVMTADSRSEADFNNDGVVNGDDFLIWQTGFNQFEGDATQDDGDATTDGLVDGDDFLVWQQQFAPADGAASAVPEPTSAALAILVALACGVVAMRKRLG